MNPMVQAYFNSELKWGRYGRFKQGSAKYMAAHDVNFEPKSWLLLVILLRQVTYGFEA